EGEVFDGARISPPPLRGRVGWGVSQASMIPSTSLLIRKFVSPGNNRYCERSEPRRTPGQGAGCETLWIASSALPPRNDDSFRHCEPKAKQSRSWSSHTRSSYKSRQAGFVDSINASFFLREAPFGRLAMPRVFLMS